MAPECGLLKIARQYIRTYVRIRIFNDIIHLRVYQYSASWYLVYDAAGGLLPQKYAIYYKVKIYTVTHTRALLRTLSSARRLALSSTLDFGVAAQQRCSVPPSRRRASHCSWSEKGAAHHGEALSQGVSRAQPTRREDSVQRCKPSRDELKSSNRTR